MTLITKTIVMIIGTILAIGWLYLAKASIGLYDEQIESIDSKDYFLPELFSIGYCVIEKVNINFESHFFKKKREKLIQIKGENAEFYLYTILAAQISYALTIIVIGFLFAIISDTFEIVIIAIVLICVLVYYLDYEIDDQLENRHNEMLRDLPTIMSKLALLINAGMVLKEAWSQVANTGDGRLYQEMQLTEYEMYNGLNDREALLNFSTRCNIKEIKKFVSSIEQNLEKGSGELAQSLRESSEESWNEKKQRTIQAGAAADSKLLIPTGIIFVGILAIVIIPLFTNMF